MDDQKKGRTETIIKIIGGVITIVTSLTAFWNLSKSAFWWFVDHLWLVLPVALVVFVCYWLVKKTTRGRGVWQSITSRFKRVIDLRTLIVILLAANAFNAGVLACQYWSRPKIKSITGNIYYRPCESNSGLDPAPDVRVFLSERNLKSEPTGPDGKFSISGIPTDFQIHQLTAQLGGLHYLMPYKAEGGDYAVIPRPCERPIIWEVHTPWRTAPADQCFSENEEATKTKRRYLLQTSIPAEGRHEAVLTVELQDTINVTILSAFVLSPSEQSGRYREAMEDLNENTAHRWVFDLPINGLTIELEVCLGSNDNPAALSEKHLHTYYELR